jgi:hypothetical protein
MPLRRTGFVLPIAVFAFAIASCSRGPSTVKQPAINASSAGSAAVEEFDKNGDAQLSGDELDHVSSLKSALARLDANSDKAVTADEISSRIKTWQGMRTGRISFSFTMTMDGAPMSGATVTFEPEQFLGSDIKAANATTNSAGRGGASIPPADGENPATALPGMQIGFYRIRVSKIVGGKETIPAKYNTQTTLGQEVAYDVPEIAGNRVVYALSSK